MKILKFLVSKKFSFLDVVFISLALVSGTVFSFIYGAAVLIVGSLISSIVNGVYVSLSKKKFW